MKKLMSAVFVLFIANCSFSQSKNPVTVNFDFNKSDLTPEAITKLDDLAGKLQQAEIISIFLGGHCDSKGTNPYNDALSLRRINSVKQYFITKKKINPSVFTIKAFGENNLLNLDSTEEDSYQNRRVEIIAVLKTKQVEQPAPEPKKETRTITAILEDTATKKGALISIPNLEFYNSSDQVLPKSEPTLHELLDVLRNNPKMKISIEGHICCVAYAPDLPLEQQPNYNISVIRAKMVYDFLLKNQIGADRISYKAFGNSHPIYPIPEKTEEERNANRRVEIRILDK